MDSRKRGPSYTVWQIHAWIRGVIWSLQNTTSKGVYRAFMGNPAEPFTRRAGQKGHYNCICGKLLSGKWIQGSVQSKILWWTQGRIYLFPIGKKYRYRLHPLHKTYQKSKCFQILVRGFPVISSMTEITVLMNPRFGIQWTYLRYYPLHKTWAKKSKHKSH